MCHSRAVMAKKFTKKHDALAKLLFHQSKPIGFLTFSLPSPSSLLKLPFVVSSDGAHTNNSLTYDIFSPDRHQNNMNS